MISLLFSTVHTKQLYNNSYLEYWQCVTYVPVLLRGIKPTVDQPYLFSNCRISISVTMRTTALFAFLSVLFFVENCDGVEDVVILLSLDSFRPKDLKKGLTRNIENVRREGSYAESIKPRFPTKTLPNHVSLVTGYWKIFLQANNDLTISRNLF